VRRQIVLSGLAAALLALPVAAADSPEAARARAVAQDVLTETKAVLEGALKGGQPAAAALRVCAGVAQNIARKHEQEGWRVRRVSEKVRNPADTPDPDERDVLKFWAEEKQAGRLGASSEHAEIVTEGGKRYFRYMRPIFIAGPVCLQCHGSPDKLGPGVAEALKELYPGDQATGYAVGDLRGAISVRIPMEAER
jgi:hypothetical protein